MNIAVNAYLRLNQKDEAQKAAELYLKVAKTPEDRQTEQQLMDRVNRTSAPTTRSLPQQPAQPADSGAR